MVNIDIINGEIASLEQKETTYVVVERLAWLYIVRDHLQIGTAPHDVNVSRETVPEIKMNSEFLDVCKGVNIEDLLNIIDEHMEVLKVVYPKEYDAIINKISQLNPSS